MNSSVLITRMVLKNYKSIAGCSVPLRSLVFLIGHSLQNELHLVMAKAVSSPPTKLLK